MKEFRVYYTSDTHGYLYPTDYAGKTEKPMGLFKLATNFQKDGNTLILDGGDTIQGSPFTNYTHRLRLRPHPIARVINKIGYDYITLGNHDFNYGLDELQSYLEDVNAVCLCANIRDKQGKLPILPYAIHTLENGLKIGITGVCTHFVRVWEKKETLEKLIIEKPVPAAAKALEEMRGKADITICIYHGGYECDLKTGVKLTDSEENQAFALCQALGFDLVLTGHQHMAVPQARIHGILSLQPAYRAVHYGRIDGKFNELNGEKLLESGLYPPAEHTDPDLVNLLLPLETSVQKWLDTPKGHLDRSLETGDHLKMAMNGSLFANFVNTIQMEYANTQLSATSIGNDTKGMDQDVTIRDVVASYIYSNTLVKLQITGKQLKKYLERSAEYFTIRNGQVEISDDFLQPKIEHYNYDYFFGLDYTFDLTRPLGDRVTSMIFQGKEIKPEDLFTLCVNNYRATGTGGYDVLKEAKVIQEIQEDVSELIIAYLENHDHIHINTHQSLTIRL